MTVQEALVAALEAHAALTTLVGSGASSRIFPLDRAEQVDTDDVQMPCLVYARVGTNRFEDFCGPGGLSDTAFSLNCFGATRASAVAVAAAVRVALEASALAYSLVDELDDYDIETKLSIVALQVSIHYDET